MIDGLNAKMTVLKIQLKLQFTYFQTIYNFLNII